MKTPQSSVTRRLVCLGLALLGANAARADYNPINLTPSSFNADVVVEAGAPKGIFISANATIDGGTNNNGNTFYEVGLNSSQPATGLPVHGTTITSQSDPTRQYLMPPSYTANNAILIGGANFPNTASFVAHFSNGTFVVTTPAAFSVLSFFYAGGGANTINYTVHHADLSVESGSISTIDWFNTAAAPVWVAGGRISLDNAQVNTLNTTTQTKLLNVDIGLGNTTSPVTSVDFTYASGGSRSFFFGMSGSTGGNFTPIAVTGYNVDCVVEANAAAVDSILGKTTVTVDQGTNNSGNTYYERGFDVAAPTTGLPPAGSNVTNTPGDHVFTMPATYVGNNCLFIANQAGYINGTFTFTTPAPLFGVSFFGAAGNGPLIAGYTIHYSDASTESGSISITDWFNAATSMYTAAGRFVPDSLTFNNVGTLTGSKVYNTDIVPLNSTLAITSIDFAYTSGGRAPIFAVSAQTNSGGTFVPRAVTGFNGDCVVEASGWTTAQLRPSPHPANLRTGVTTVSMDGGTNNNGNTWFERGYYAQFPQAGLPPAGSTFNSAADSTKHYQLPSTYTGNNAVFVDFAHTQANLTITSPQTYSALSFLNACANSFVTNAAIMQYADGSTESNFFVGGDWFNGNPYAFTSLGRMSLDSRTINNDPGRANPTNQFNPRLYEAGFTLFNSGSAVTNIILKFLGAANATSGRIVIMAVSGTAGAVPPIFSSQPSTVATNEAQTVNFFARATATFPITYQWQAGAVASGLYTNVLNAGQFSGVTSTNLVISSVGYSNIADYVLIATDAAGSVTSSPASLNVISSLPDVLTPGDPITGFGTDMPAAETVDHAIDGFAQKYLNYGNGGTHNPPYSGPVGFTVTPSIGATIISVMRLYTANDTVGRDPADYLIEGSNDGGATWSTVSSGALNLPAGRNGTGNIAVNPFTQFLQEIRFANTTSFTSYRWTVNNVKDPLNVNSMQIGEVQFLGVQTPTPPVITAEPPLLVTNYVGASPNLRVSAIGFPTNLTYQWSHNGSPISGATQSSYTKSNVQLSDSGSTYQCAIANVNGNTNTVITTLYVIAAPTQPYPVAIMADNPLAWYRLGEGPDNGSGNNGTVANDLWGGHPGVYTNAAIAQPGYAPTVDPDTAANFGSVAFSDSCVDKAGGLGNFTSGGLAALSVEAWVNGSVSQGDGAGIVSYGYGGGGEVFALDCGNGTSPANGIRFYVRDNVSGASHPIGSSTLASDGLWHHVVGVYSQAASNEVLYIDGLPVVSNFIVSPFGLRAPTTPLTIGSRSSTVATNNDLQFTGNIDEVALYSTALSGSQVLNHYYAAHYPPLFTLQPADTTAGEGSTVVFHSSAYGTPTVSYQWSQSTDGGSTFNPLSGQTSANLTLVNVPATSSGYQYHVTASNPYGSVTSTNVTLTVVGGPPTFVTDIPTGPTLIYAGTVLAYSPVIGGTAPITYQWMHNGANMNDDGRITGSHTANLNINYTIGSDSGTYQLHVSNNQGTADSALSTINVETTPDFNTTGYGWTGNGSASFANDTLTLTVGAGSTASSAWYNFPVYVGGFTASFTYQDVSVGGADGAAFVLQNDPRGVTALGAGGGSLGVAGVTPSAELEFNIYAPNTPGGGTGGSYAFHVNGANGGYTSASPVQIDSGDPINVTVTYSGGILSMKLQDANTLATYTASTPFNVPGAVGGNTAYVGFTGADGGVSSIQTITNFSYTPIVSLSAVQTSPTTLQLTWPMTGGYVLQSATVVSGPYTDVTPIPTSPLSVPITGPAKFYRLKLTGSEP